MTAAPEAIVDWITTESDVFARTLELGSLDARVPGCPEWSQHALATHLGRVQEFWASVIRVGADTEPAFDGDPDHPEPAPYEVPALVEWMRGCTRDLLVAIANVRWDAPAWVWWKEPRTAGAIVRHQAQEAAVHRWDAQSTFGDAAPIPDDLALDALEEFVGNVAQLSNPPAIELRPNGATAITTGDAAPVAALAGDALRPLVVVLRPHRCRCRAR